MPRMKNSLCYIDWYSDETPPEAIIVSCMDSAIRAMSSLEIEMKYYEQLVTDAQRRLNDAIEDLSNKVITLKSWQDRYSQMKGDLKDLIDEQEARRDTVDEDSFSPSNTSLEENREV